MAIAALAAVLSVLAALGSTALTIGAGNIAEKIETTMNYNNKVDSDDILRYINELTIAARNKGNKAISILNNRLANLQLPLGISSNVKDTIMDRRRELASLLQKSQNSMAEVETKLVSAENRASNLAAQPENVKRVVGKITKDKIVSDVTPALEQVNKIEKEIENYVSKKKDA